MILFRLSNLGDPVGKHAATLPQQVVNRSWSSVRSEAAALYGLDEDHWEEIDRKQSKWELVYGDSGPFKRAKLHKRFRGINVSGHKCSGVFSVFFGERVETNMIGWVQMYLYHRPPLADNRIPNLAPTQYVILDEPTWDEIVLHVPYTQVRTLRCIASTS